MDNKKQSKLMFYQSCDGDFTRRMQMEFEKAQKLARDTGSKTKIGCEIIIGPPDQTKRFGNVKFKVKPATAPYESMEYTTELNDDGEIIGDGKSIDTLLQMELFPEEDDKITKFNKESNS